MDPPLKTHLYCGAIGAGSFFRRVASASGVVSMLPAMSQGVRRFKVEAELIVEVTDPIALTREALEAVDAVPFPAQGDRSAEEVHAAAHAEVRDDVAAALESLTDPDAMVITDAGLQVVLVTAKR
ncbi:hypothetical protein OWR29_26535 [Actinoplanes sp. Pm04-4]|uniref:Uncharacterized protein n=1 Tax=Paractinoplanes pyxinae TaxID=2997416 RepID=A0ABT4B519_9ACTN|nr:hypothetical protein [Actinoplanes pyxinae]MCY1141571.1 hypothetical protein [Actinoplanes pyxinae]